MRRKAGKAVCNCPLHNAVADSGGFGFGTSGMGVVNNEDVHPPPGQLGACRLSINNSVIGEPFIVPAVILRLHFHSGKNYLVHGQIHNGCDLPEHLTHQFSGEAGQGNAQSGIRPNQPRDIPHNQGGLPVLGWYGNSVIPRHVLPGDGIIELARNKQVHSGQDVAGFVVGNGKQKCNKISTGF